MEYREVADEQRALVAAGKPAGLASGKDCRIHGRFYLNRKMTEAGIGRVLVASLHQAIADLLPERLEFYENWLNPTGLRHGTIGLAPLNAVLSFLREDDHVYPGVVQLAGRYAAEWTMSAQGRGRQWLVRFSPRPLRQRAAVSLIRRTVRRSYAGSRAVVRLRRGRGTVVLRASLFCNVREAAPAPLCGFYAALVSRLLELHRVGTRVEVRTCRAVGDRTCVLDVEAGV